MIVLPLLPAVILLAGRGIRLRTANAGLFLLASIISFSPWLIKNAVMTGNPVFPLANHLFRAEPPGWNAESTARWNEGHHPAPDERSMSARLNAFWRHVPGDPVQRFGPALLLLAIMALAARPQSPCDVALLVILLTQMAVWLFATHLYARFAVVLLIPLSILGGRAMLNRDRSISACALIVLCLGAAWNFYHTARLMAHESMHGAHASWFYDGRIKGFEYLDYVNNQLPEDSKILLIGEAKGFYFRRPIVYTVVFNESPFVNALRSADRPSDVLRWLSDRGCTHVLMHWSEIERLRRSRYGFPEEVNPDLLNHLVQAGLRKIRDFNLPDGRPYVTLYEVTPR
jgi:hypothetical protein